MKLYLFLFMLLCLPIISSLQITEVESNPLGTDTGNEWIELYSSEEINLENYTFINNDGDQIIINNSFKGYYVYIFQTQWLDNTDEKILIYKDSKVIDQTPLFDDILNNEETFSFCEEWIMQEQTKGKENCVEVIIQENQNEVETSKEQLKNVIEEIPFEINESKTMPKQEIIYLNPKTIKTEKTTFKLQSNQILKYSFGIFCVLLTILYIIKPKKRKNEWTNKNNSNDGD